jgi:NAD+ kinase
MNVILFSRKQVNHRAEQLRTMFDVIARLGLEYTINEEFADVVEDLLGLTIDPSRRFSAQAQAAGDDVMVTYGGDGTLLDGVQRLPHYAVPVVGINCGRLGYLTADNGDGIEELFERIVQGKVIYERRSMLRVEGDFGDEGGYLALNEATIHRHGATMISLLTQVNGNRVSTYHGDGLVVSTPTGSTAYSLSAGGPIVEPEARNILITPICAHDVGSRCIVASEKRVISVNMVKNARRNAYLSVDGGKAFRLNMGDVATVKTSKLETKLVRLKDRSFYDVVNAKFKRI